MRVHALALAAGLLFACDSGSVSTPTQTGGVRTDTGGGQATGGLPASTGGASAGTGGITANTGGIRSGTGGVVSGTGGLVANTGGVRTGGIAPGTGGITTGGTSVSTGGIRTGGIVASTGGIVAGTGGIRTGGVTVSTGGTTPATGGTTASGLVSCTTSLPAHTSSTTTSSTIPISGVKDYAMQRVCADPNTLGPGDQTESQKPIFMLAKGATLKNVVIGGAGCSAADGVHCESGSCTLENVWFGDVGEDAITFKGSDASQVMTITGGGAWSASDKTIQHNGPGTIKITGFYFNTVGKGYRSCGNCSNNGFARHVEMTNVAVAGKKAVIAGINSNYGDTATFKQVNLCGTGSTVCQKFTGVTSGEPVSGPSGADGKNCIYSASDITN